jgi:hypothetical protein
MFPSSVITQNPTSQSACWQPLANGHRPPANTPTGMGRGLPARGDRAGKHYVRAVPVNLFERLTWKQRGKNAAAVANHRNPADRPLDPGQRLDDPQSCRQAQFQPAATVWDKKAEEADRS